MADLKEVRDQVVRAWKLEKARPLAKKAADELAAKVKADGGQIKDLHVDGRPVISIDSATKLKPGMPIPSQFGGQFRFQRGPATLTELPQIPEAGPPLLDSLFALKPGEVAVEPDLPKTTYYVMTLDKRDPVSYMALMGPNGSLAAYRSETQDEMLRKGLSRWHGTAPRASRLPPRGLPLRGAGPRGRNRRVKMIGTRDECSSSFW